MHVLPPLSLKTPGRAAVSASAKFKGHAILGFHHFSMCSVRLRHPSRLQVLNLLRHSLRFSQAPEAEDNEINSGNHP